MADNRPTEDQRLLRESLDVLAPVTDELVDTFYGRLFSEYPRLRDVFPRERLMRVLLALARRYDDPRRLLPAFSAMGRRSVRFGAGVEEYAAVGAVLLRTLRDLAGTAWTPAFHGAWVRAYTFAAATMMRADAVADEEDLRLAA